MHARTIKLEKLCLKDVAESPYTSVCVNSIRMMLGGAIRMSEQLDAKTPCVQTFFFVFDIMLESLTHSFVKLAETAIAGNSN